MKSRKLLLGVLFHASFMGNTTRHTQMWAIHIGASSERITEDGILEKKQQTEEEETLMTGRSAKTLDRSSIEGAYLNGRKGTCSSINP